MTNETLTKNQVISLRIMALVAAGMNIRAAIDEVLGAGTCAALIDDLYNALRAKAQAQ